jgi:hypothetical protein
MSSLLLDPTSSRQSALAPQPEPPQLRVGRPGPEAVWLPLAETTPLLLIGNDMGAHRTMRRLLDDWAQTLAETGHADVLAWGEMDIILNSAGRPGVSVTPSLGVWLAALRQAVVAGVSRPTVFIGYEVTGSAGGELLAAAHGQALEGLGSHLLWATTPDSAGGRLARDLSWRSHLEVEPDARHIVLSRAGREPERLLAD